MNKPKLYYCAETDVLFLFTEIDGKLISRVFDNIYISELCEKKSILRNTILLDEDFYGCANDSDRHISGVNK